MNLLKISNLKVKIADKEILSGVNLSMQKGEVQAIMGPNGSGKSTLAATLAGHPAYQIVDGTIEFANTVINDLSPDKRAKKGIFLAFQYPLEIEGAIFGNFLRQAYNAIHGGTEKQLGIKAFKDLMRSKMEMLKIAPEFIERYINFGFSGGEKKRVEVLQLAVLSPKLAILDEIDSGLDIDALKIVCSGINEIRKENPDMSFLIITHYPRILNFLVPNKVHVMQNGVITQSGGPELAHKIEEEGYATR